MYIIQRRYNTLSSALFLLSQHKNLAWNEITNKSLALLPFRCAINNIIRKEDQYGNTVAMVTVRLYVLTDNLFLTENAASIT